MKTKNLNNKFIKDYVQLVVHIIKYKKRKNNLLWRHKYLSNLTELQLKMLLNAQVWFENQHDDIRFLRCNPK